MGGMFLDINRHLQAGFQCFISCEQFTSKYKYTSEVLERSSCVPWKAERTFWDNVLCGSWQPVPVVGIDLEYVGISSSP